MSDKETERLCVGGPFDGQRFMFRSGQAAFPLMTEQMAAAWYRVDPDNSGQVLYSGPEYDGMDVDGYEGLNGSIDATS